jgi:hypothetical protein
LRTLSLTLLLAAWCSAAAVPARADPAPFDLAGPSLQVSVARAGVTLPISQAPDLAEGDRLSVKAVLPAGQSAHYLLVVAFLRGATDPPPASWFHRSETWKAKAGGLTVEVPQGAGQAMLFLAPDTGGGFDTLVKAVRGRPGAFVRASQDLNQASLDRSRLDVFLSRIRLISQSEPERLKTVAPLLARSLAIKLDSPCLEKAPALQADCLTQGQESLVLRDEHGRSIAQTLTSGSMADLVQQLSVAPQVGAGAYSPYVGAVMDIVRILDGFHTAQYQYLPALATREGDTLSLLLNAPPAFHNPKSVLVAALPAVSPAPAPVLHPLDPDGVYCADQAPLVLPADGAPTVFSTEFAHDLTLRLKAKDGAVIDAPLKADPEKGGFVADTSRVDRGRLDAAAEGSVRGSWGFRAYDGPTFRLASAQSWQGRIAADDKQVLIAGRGGAIRLEGPGAACVESVLLGRPSGETVKVDWKAAGPDALEVKAPPGEAKPGPLTLLVKSYGVARPEAVPLRTFVEPSRLDGFTIHAGDPFGQLKGTLLGEVAGLTFAGVDYRPDPFATPPKGGDVMLYAAAGRPDATLADGQSGEAEVLLKDGRKLPVQTSVAPPRPRVTLIAKSVQAAPGAAASRIQLADHEAVARSSVLTFSVRSREPASFSGHEQIEVETPRGEFTTMLTLANGLTLADAQVAIATLDTGKAFGPSAAGRLSYRLVVDGVAGDWQPLATLVRLPGIREVNCPPAPARPCRLTGSSLFLLDALANNAAFENAVQVPDGFAGSALSVPRPVDGRLFVKLRDDPSAINPLIVPVKPPAPSPVARGPAAGADRSGALLTRVGTSRAIRERAKALA